MSNYGIICMKEDVIGTWERGISDQIRNFCLDSEWTWVMLLHFFYLYGHI